MWLAVARLQVAPLWLTRTLIKLPMAPRWHANYARKLTAGGPLFVPHKGQAAGRWHVLGLPQLIPM